MFDEMFGPVVARALTILGEASGDAFSHILDFEPKGTLDDDIPKVCRDNSQDVLISLNVRDFGAKKVLYQALLSAGVSVIVVRPGNVKMTDSAQLSIMSSKYPHFSKKCRGAAVPLLVRVTQSDVTERTLDELIKEIQSGDRRRP
jgi:hypothetical protein